MPQLTLIRSYTLVTIRIVIQILYTDNKIHNLRVFIEWSDTETDTMDNQADTNARNKLAKLDVNLHFVQIAN